MTKYEKISSLHKIARTARGSRKKSIKETHFPFICICHIWFIKEMLRAYYTNICRHNRYPLSIKNIEEVHVVNQQAQHYRVGTKLVSYMLTHVHVLNVRVCRPTRYMTDDLK